MPGTLLLVLVILLVGALLLVKLTLSAVRWLAINAITGLLIVGVLNYLGVTHVPINGLTLVILAVGGVIGAFILILLSLF